MKHVLSSSFKANDYKNGASVLQLKAQQPSIHDLRMNLKDLKKIS
jgi:hypothetical protein